MVLAGHAGDAATARAALADADPGVRAAAVGALARCGALTAGDLVTALADPASAVRRRAAEEAARAGTADPGVGLALLDRTADGEPTVAEAAAFALGELDPPPRGAAEALTRLLDHAEVVVRETAVAALGSLGLGLPAVLRATHDVATVRRRAVLALAAFAGPEVEDALERLARDRDRQVRQAAEDLLHGWGAPA